MRSSPLVKEQGKEVTLAAKSRGGEDSNGAFSDGRFAR
jgi:hypothetical protein